MFYGLITTLKYNRFIYEKIQCPRDYKITVYGYCDFIKNNLIADYLTAVSYTHLDVYKRQLFFSRNFGNK